MKTSLFLTCLLLAASAMAEPSLSGSSAGTLGLPAASGPSAVSTSGMVSGPMTSTNIPQAGTSSGSPQNAGPLNSAPNGAGGTYGYPNAAIDPNTASPGLPQQPYYGSPSYNYGTGTVSGTTTTVNPAGAPFVTPPAGAPTSSVR